MILFIWNNEEEEGYDGRDNDSENELSKGEDESSKCELESSEGEDTKNMKCMYRLDTFNNVKDEDEDEEDDGEGKHEDDEDDVDEIARDVLNICGKHYKKRNK